MKKIQITAKTVQKAIEDGLKELNATQDQVDIKILEEGGLFRKAKIELILDKDIEEERQKEIIPKAEVVKEEPNSVIKKEEIIVSQAKTEKTEKKQEEKIIEKERSDKDFAICFLKELCQHMNVEAEITFFETDEGITFNAEGEKVSTLIGKRGDTLNAIQDILSNVMKNNGYREKRFFFDVENYKNRREISLVNLAERMANKALKISKPIKLERMNAYERKIIHTALQNFEGVSTRSEGEEPNRHLVIIPKKN